MDYYVLSTTGDLRNPALAIVDEAPQGMGIRGYGITHGRSVRDIYPKKARIQLGPDRKGVLLADLVGNTASFVIASPRLRELIAAASRDLELLPFTLLDRTGKPLSSDYTIVNVLRVGDWRDGTETGLFRDRADPTTYHLDGDLARAIREAGCTNVSLTPLNGGSVATAPPPLTTRAAPPAPAASAPKRTAAGKQAAPAVLSVWASDGRAEDAALLAWLVEAGVAHTRLATLRLGRRAFDDEPAAIWHLFSSGRTVHVAVRKRGKERVESFVAHDEEDDDPSNYNAWDELKPLVVGRPFVVADGAVFVGFHGALAERLRAR